MVGSGLESTNQGKCANGMRKCMRACVRVPTNQGIPVLGSAELLCCRPQPFLHADERKQVDIQGLEFGVDGLGFKV